MTERRGIDDESYAECAEDDRRTVKGGEAGGQDRGIKRRGKPAR